MKKQFFLVVLTAVTLFTTPAFSQVKIIFDTDLGGDADDLGALVMLNNFIDKGECRVLGVMCWTTEQYAVSAIDAVNRFYKHPGIPIGIRKGDAYFTDWNYSKPIADSFYHTITNTNARDATSLYRQLLAKADDKSVVIVTVGPLMNIQELIKSGADAYSSLTGKELIEKKVKEFVMMGGQYPEGIKEWNFYGNMPGVTQFVLHNITVPVTFSGYEIGVTIKTGEVFNSIDHHSPLYVGFMHFSQNAPWMKAQYKGSIYNNATYDQTAVLYAVRKGVGVYWDKIEGGYCEPNETGGNKWVKGAVTNHSYLKLKMSPEKIGLVIESIMLNHF